MFFFNFGPPKKKPGSATVRKIKYRNFIRLNVIPIPSNYYTIPLKFYDNICRAVEGSTGSEIVLKQKKGNQPNFIVTMRTVIIH